MLLEVLTEDMIVGMVILAALSLIGFKKSLPPVMLISSLGWVIMGLMWYKGGGDLLVMALMVFLAFAQFLVVSKK